MTSPTNPEVPLHTRLLDAASTLALYAEARAVAPSVVQEARALIERIPALMTEAATTLIGKQALLRQLMDAYTAAGGEGVASLEAIEAAIKHGVTGKQAEDDCAVLRKAFEEASASCIHSIGPVFAARLMQEAADALTTCKAAAERALGATAGTVEEAVELLATEHGNLKASLEKHRAAVQARLKTNLARFDKVAAEMRTATTDPAPLSSLLDGPDPAPVALPPPDLQRALQMPDARPPTYAEARAEFLARTATPARDEIWCKGVEIRDVEIRREPNRLDEVIAVGPSRNGPYPARPEFAEEVRDYLQAMDTPCSLCKRLAVETADRQPCRGRCLKEPPGIVTVEADKEAGCWRVLVDGRPAEPEVTVYAFDRAKAVERANVRVRPESAKPIVSIVLPALRFEDKRITSSNTLSVLCGDREIWTGNGTCELDIRTTLVENQISYAHPLTFDSMMEAKGTIWLQANDEAAALLRTYRNGSIGLVLCFPAAKSLFTALLFDVADGERPPNSETGWIGFTLALETP